MTEEFCTRTARRIRRFGYAPVRAAWLAKACFLLMLTLCGALLMALGRRRAGLFEGSEDLSGSVMRLSCGRPDLVCLPVRNILFSCGLPPLVPAIQRRLPAF